MEQVNEIREDFFKNPESVCELLWFHGLVFRDFFELDGNVQEFAYIPSDLIPLLPRFEKSQIAELGFPATGEAIALIYATNDHIIDHACTLLSLFRTGSITQNLEKISKSWPNLEITEKPSSPFSLTIDALSKILLTANLINETHQLSPVHVREFLEASRNEALKILFDAWRNSTQVNEIRIVPILDCQGEWSNNPLTTRTKFLDMFFSLPIGKWWSIPAFIQSIKITSPDFQRSAGEYDSWIIRNKATNEYLHGYDRWNEVEGELIKFFISGPLHWFGLADLAAPSQDLPISSFRKTRLAEQLSIGSIPTISARNYQTYFSQIRCYDFHIRQFIALCPLPTNTILSMASRKKRLLSLSNHFQIFKQRYKTRSADNSAHLIAQKKRDRTYHLTSSKL